MGKYIDCKDCQNQYDCERTYLGGCTDGKEWEEKELTDEVLKGLNNFHDRILKTRIAELIYEHEIMSIVNAKDLIHRLQSENAEQKAEIERLTEELRSKTKEFELTEKALIKNVGENVELQKQVDELKERNYWLKSEHEYQCEKSYFEGVEKGQQQAVKDAAKEILQELFTQFSVDCIEHMMNRYKDWKYAHFIKDFAKERYGVEVE